MQNFNCIQFSLYAKFKLHDTCNIETISQYNGAMCLSQFCSNGGGCAAARRSGGIGLHQRLISSTVNMNVVLSHTHLIVYALIYFLTSKSILMPCPFTSPKMFWAGPNFLCQKKNLFTYCGSRKHFVPDKKMICIP